MYLFISITDDALFNDSGTAWYNDDGVEVFIDGGNEKTAAYDGNDFQLAFIWDRIVWQEGGNNKSPVTDINYTMSKTTDGYTLEIEIPWSSLKTTPSIGATVGFDLGVNDDDNGAGRENKISWNQKTDIGWQNPSVFGEVVLLDEIPSDVTQTIKLDQGWNLISFSVIPANSDISSVFAPVINKVEMIKNDDGFYNPSLPAAFQSIKTVESGEGYLVKMSEPSTLNISGAEITNRSAQLVPGWNMIGYPQQSCTDISTTVGANVQTIKDFEGYYQPGGVNGITSFEPGKAYFIQVNAAGTIAW